jgi:hypothetical protein
MYLPLAGVKPFLLDSTPTFEPKFVVLRPWGPLNGRGVVNQRSLYRRVLVVIGLTAIVAMLIVPAGSSTPSVQGGLDHFVIANIGSQTAGAGFSVQATAVDNSGNPLGTRYHGTPTLSGTLHGSTTGCGTDGTSSCTVSYANPPTVVNGVATWQNVTAYKAETGRTVTASDAGKTGTSDAFIVGPNVPATLTFTQQPTDALPGQSITPDVQVLNQDRYGNPEVGVPVTIAIGDSNPSNGILSPPGSLTQNGDVQGVATFPGLSIDKIQSEHRLQASSGAASQLSAYFNIANVVAQCDKKCSVPASAPDGFASVTVTVTGSTPGSVSITFENPRSTCSAITDPAGTGDLVTVNPVGVSGVVQVSGVLRHRNNGGGVGNFQFCKNSGPATDYFAVPDCNKKQTNAPCMIKVNGFGAGDVEFTMLLKRNSDGTWDPALSGGH